MDTTKKNNTGLIIIAVILIIAAFFGGKAYGSSHATPSMGGMAMNGTAGGYGRMGGFAGRGGTGGGATIGQVVSMDSSSITVSLPAGGSKIILYSPTTTVMKTTTGAISDIAAGSIITATGTANSDGSVTATAIQIRPAGSTLPTAPTTGSAMPTTSSATQ
jgi:hypothetical protein